MIDFFGKIKKELFDAQGNLTVPVYNGKRRVIGQAIVVKQSDDGLYVEGTLLKSKEAQKVQKLINSKLYSEILLGVTFGGKKKRKKKGKK